MKFAEIQSIEDLYQVETYKKMGIAVERGRGPWVWTSEGDKYLDLYGGHAVCATGHSHPHVVTAIQEQAERLLFYSNLVYSEIRAKAAERLVSVAPASLTRSFFCNSGTEANENAMRMARMATGRQNVISFAGGFHGRTADSISATYLADYRQLGAPNVPGHVSAEFGDIDSVAAVADSDTAAIIIEPIQSMAGVREAAPAFFVRLRELCDDLGIILIFDEVQTGLGRTGHWFFAGSDNAGDVEPDIITLAKSLGSGVPVGACVVNDRIAKSIKVNNLGTTFGGGMLAMAAVLATLEVIEGDELMTNARQVESYLRTALASNPGVDRIRGKGCLIGITFFDPCEPVHARLLENRIITGTSSDPNVLRLLPPLGVGISDLEAMVKVLET